MLSKAYPKEGKKGHATWILIGHINLGIGTVIFGWLVILTNSFVPWDSEYIVKVHGAL